MNEKFYKRLIAQAEEARELGMTRLADQLMRSLAKTEAADEDVQVEVESKEISPAVRERLERELKPFDNEALRRTAHDSILDILMALHHAYKLTFDASQLDSNARDIADDLLAQLKTMMQLPALPPSEKPLPGVDKSIQPIKRKKK